MYSDGKQLENLVSFVEKNLLPKGFVVTSNQRVYNDDGVQIAEFDIEIRGKVGSTTIAWLIECRDRPCQGPAPGSWIEQLVGRRTRFGFNKVTAVSTTGFAVGAMSFARDQGIELREVKNFDPSEFLEWLTIVEMHTSNRITELKHASVFIHESEPAELKNAATKVIESADGHTPILRIADFRELLTLSAAFHQAVHTLDEPFKDVTPSLPKPIRIRAEYPSDVHYFLLETPLGGARIAAIEFFGELRVVEGAVPIVKKVEYRHTETGEAISQLAAFAPQSVLGMNLAIELHHMEESGVTHVTMRRVRDA